MKRGFVQGKGIRLAYVDFGGSGTHVILLHGVMARATTWFDTAMWLREKYHVIGFDQRGHGLSDKPKTGYKREDFVEDIVQAMKELNIDNAIFIGHSTGAMNAWALAAHYPRLVKALVIEDMHAQAKAIQEYLDGWKTWFIQNWPVPFSCLKEARQFFDSQRPSYTDNFMESLEERESGYWPVFNFDHILETLYYNNVKSWWDELRQIECPTLVIKGGASQEVSREEAEKMAKVIPKGRFVEIPDAHHVVHDAQPKLFREAVESFLAEIEG